MLITPTPNTKCPQGAQTDTAEQQRKAWEEIKAQQEQLKAEEKRLAQLQSNVKEREQGVQRREQQLQKYEETLQTKVRMPPAHFLLREGGEIDPSVLLLSSCATPCSRCS